VFGASQSQAFTFDHVGELVDESIMDAYLIDRGMPTEALETLTYHAKYEIYSTLDHDTVFEGFEDRKVFLENPEETNLFSIPKSQLSFTVSGWKNSDGTYSIYPSFYWHTQNRIQNDSFGFALNSKYWDAVSGATLNVILRNSFGGSTNHFYDRRTGGSFAGHYFRMSNLTNSSLPGLEGHGHFRARPVGSRIDRKISIGYADDPGRSPLSYSISIGGFPLILTLENLV